MLKSVKPVAGLVLVQSHQGSDVDVRIVAFDVCVRMMVNVVFYLPYVCIAPEHIECVGGNRVQPGMLRKTLVPSLVHYVEPDHSEVKAKYDAQQNCPWPRQGEEHHHRIYRKRGGHLYGSLRVQLPVPRDLKSRFGKVAIFLLLDLLEKPGVFVWFESNWCHDVV